MLDRGDEPQSFDEVLLLGLHAALLQRAQHLSEDPLHLATVRPWVDSVVVEELPEHVVVCLRVHGLLADEAAHRRSQFFVTNQGERFVVGLDKPALSLGEKQIEHADEVGSDWMTRNPVQRNVAPVECHVACVKLDITGIGVVVLWRGWVRCEC